MSIILGLKSNPDLLKQYIKNTDGKIMFLEDIAVVTLSTKFVNPKINPICIATKVIINKFGSNFLNLWLRYTLLPHFSLSHFTPNYSLPQFLTAT